MVLTPTADTTGQRPLRVTIISQGHPSLVIGGSERSALSLFDNLKAMEGISPTFVARAEHRHLGHDGHFGRFRGRPDEILWVPPPLDHFRMVSRSPDTLRQQVSELLADTRPDIVHVHHYGAFGADLFRIIAEVGQVPVVATLHEYLAICHNHGQMVKVAGGLCDEEYYTDCHACYPEYSSGKFFLRKQLLLESFAPVARYLAPSRFLAERYISWGLPRDRVAVAENPLPLRPPPEGARPIRGGGRPLILGFFGQITPFKGVDILLDALLIAQALLPPGAIELALFGANLEFWQPGFRDAIEAKIVALGPAVKRRGPYRNEDVLDLMRRVDWVVVPSIWWENSPVVIQEAKAAGVPVLCSNIGGMAEKVSPGRDGLHFKAGDARDLAEKLIVIASGGADDLRPVPMPQAALTSAIVDAYRLAATAA
jgi:glycosyltransferase involved in cell wall biosynthesis